MKALRVWIFVLFVIDVASVVYSAAMHKWPLTIFAACTIIFMMGVASFSPRRDY